jgi:tRNA pseudouridine55 synthase
MKQLHGVLVLDKPAGPSSTQCLERIKKRLHQKKIGHAGTLDPLARGVLVVLLGQGTKLAPFLEAGRKTYRGWLRLGLETDTYDIEGRVLAERSWDRIQPEEVQSCIQAWTELTEQEVPPFSAAKHKGKPLYALKRSGQAVPSKTKSIAIDQAELLHVELPDVSFRVTCSKGTYIRSLAHSLGMRLSCGAALTDLVREASRPFTLEQAHALSDVLEDSQGLANRVVPLAASLPHWPRLKLSPKQVGMVQNGAMLPVDQVEGSTASQEGEVALFGTEKGQPVALVQTRRTQGLLCWTILRGLWLPGGDLVSGAGAETKTTTIMH